MYLNSKKEGSETIPNRRIETHTVMCIEEGRKMDQKTKSYSLPLGNPVEPLVYMITAVSSGRGEALFCTTIIKNRTRY